MLALGACPARSTSPHCSMTSVTPGANVVWAGLTTTSPVVSEQRYTVYYSYVGTTMLPCELITCDLMTKCLREQPLRRSAEGESCLLLGHGAKFEGPSSQYSAKQGPAPLLAVHTFERS